MRPTNGEISFTFASAHATACASEKSSVRLQLMPSRWRISAARMPSHVEAILMRMRSRAMPCCLVKLDEMPAFRDERVGVERQVRVGFGGDAAGNDFQNFQAEQNQQIVQHVRQQILAAELCLVVGDGLVHEELIFRHLRGLEDERRIGRGVARRELLERGEIAGVGDDGGELLELIQLGDGAHNLVG